MRAVAQQALRGRVLSIPCQIPQFCGQDIEGWLDLGGERLTQNLAMLGFRRASMACGAPFQTLNQIITEIADVQTTHGGDVAAIYRRLTDN